MKCGHDQSQFALAQKMCYPFNTVDLFSRSYQRFGSCFYIITLMILLIQIQILGKLFFLQSKYKSNTEIIN
jgi:hypothetical protein